MMRTSAEQELITESREEEDGDLAEHLWPSQWNIMIKHRQVQRRGRRSQVPVSFTDPGVSMDLLRAVLQPSINEEIQNVFNKYMKFFQKAAINVKENVGDHVDPEQLIQDTCCNCLEQAKLLFANQTVIKPAYEVSVLKRPRHVEDESYMRRSPVFRKKKGRLSGHNLHCERNSVGFTSLKPKAADLIRREGPKWDPSRLNEKTTFVLGSHANRALGMEGTRGRIYIKHPELFKIQHTKANQIYKVPTNSGDKHLDMGRDTRFLSLNAKGLNIPEKRGSLLRELWRERVQIAFIQETHFETNKVPRLGNHRYPAVFHAPSEMGKAKRYAADAQDKQWLTELQHMKATGGKMVYLLLDQDILDLAITDEYRDSMELKLDELKPFEVPIWMIEKMRKYMDIATNGAGLVGTY